MSAILRGLPIHPPQSRLPTFRNPNGVGRKTADIATVHPNYRGKPTNGSELDKVVLNAFLTRPEHMHRRAHDLREAAERGEFTALTDPAEDEDLSAPEGRLVFRRHVSRERDPRLRKRKIASLTRTGKPLLCEACDFNFERVYGDRGRGFIECHHVVPLHVAGTRVNSTADLALLCANCHRMIHRSPWLSPAGLRAMIAGLSGAG